MGAPLPLSGRRAHAGRPDRVAGQLRASAQMWEGLAFVLAGQLEREVAGNMLRVLWLGEHGEEQRRDFRLIHDPRVVRFARRLRREFARQLAKRPTSLERQLDAVRLPPEASEPSDIDSGDGWAVDVLRGLAAIARQWAADIEADRVQRFHLTSCKIDAGQLVAALRLDDGEPPMHKKVGYEPDQDLRRLLRESGRPTDGRWIVCDCESGGRAGASKSSLKVDFLSDWDTRRRELWTMAGRKRPPDDHKKKPKPCVSCRRVFAYRRLVAGGYKREG